MTDQASADLPGAGSVPGILDEEEGPSRSAMSETAGSRQSGDAQESEGESAAPAPGPTAPQEDLTLLLTVLLGEPGEELTVIVGARSGERPHARFARLTLPRESWVAALFGTGAAGAGGGEPATTLAAYVADVAATATARARAARPAGGKPAARGERGAQRQPQSDPVPKRRRTPVPAASAEPSAPPEGTAALLARRRSAQGTPPDGATGPLRRSLFDLDDFS